MNTDIKNAIIYARSSSADNSDQNTSIDKQVNMCMEFAKKHNLNIIKVFKDYGVSGLPTDRKGFTDLMSFVKNPKHEVTLLIVTSIDRISRGLTVSLSLDQIFSSYNVKIATVNDEIINSPTFEFLREIMIAANKFEAKMNRDYVKKVGTVESNHIH